MQKYIEIDPCLSSSVDDSEWGGHYTPLHYAAYRGHADICKLLLDDPKVDINGRTVTGCTPLFFAAQQGRADIVSMLLTAGADPTKAEEECNYTAIDVGRQFKSTVFSIFKNGEEWEYEKWRQVPPALNPAKLMNPKGTSFEVQLSPIVDEDEGALKVREFKVKVVALPSGTMADLLIVPRTEWTGRAEESIFVRNLNPGTSYAVYIAGVNGMGYGPYGELSNVISTRKAKPKNDATLKNGESETGPANRTAPARHARRETGKKKKIAASRLPLTHNELQQKKREGSSKSPQTLQTPLQPVPPSSASSKSRLFKKKELKVLSLPNPTSFQDNAGGSDESSEMDFGDEQENEHRTLD